MCCKFIGVLNREFLGRTAVLRLQFLGVSVFGNVLANCILRKQKSFCYCRNRPQPLSNSNTALIRSRILPSRSCLCCILSCARSVSLKKIMLNIFHVQPNLKGRGLGTRAGRFAAPRRPLQRRSQTSRAGPRSRPSHLRAARQEGYCCRNRKSARRRSAFAASLRPFASAIHTGDRACGQRPSPGQHSAG